MTGAMDRPVLPYANIDTKRFWDGCREGKLLLQRCVACGALRHPPSPICSNCLSDAHEWIPARGRGTVYTFTVVREARRGWENLVPYVLAVIALEEGPHVLSNVINVAPERVAIGMPVEVMFSELDRSTKLPLFRPVQP
jgi:uncharacterized OB-fold protein